jgi:hypothetical protein
MDCRSDYHRLRVRAALSIPLIFGFDRTSVLILTPLFRQAISDLSFSHDGEYIAIAGAGNYIDIVRPLFFFSFVSRRHSAV